MYRNAVYGEPLIDPLSQIVSLSLNSKSVTGRRINLIPNDFKT